MEDNILRMIDYRSGVEVAWHNVRSSPLRMGLQKNEYKKHEII